jgi:DNA repair protein RadA/Sms
VSLSGAVRPVAQAPARLKEAQKLGFARAIVPEAGAEASSPAMTLNPVGSLVSLVSDIAARGEKSPKTQDGNQRRRAPEDE